MEFKSIVVQPIGNTENPFAYAGTNDSGDVIKDVLDGENPRNFYCSRLSVEQKKTGESFSKTILFVQDVEVKITVTDCRVIIFCPKFDRGDAKWSGGLAAVALNAYEKNKAERRSSGKVLLGHIRYEWLYTVGYVEHRKKGLFDTEQKFLSLSYLDNNKNTYTIEALYLNGDSSADLANYITHRAAEYKLRMTNDKTSEEESMLKQWTNQTIKPNSNDRMYSYAKFPVAFYAPQAETYRPIS